MIPQGSGVQGVSRGRLPTLTFYLDETGEKLQGMTDGWHAARQAAWLILHTERYQHIIYSFHYGTELQSLFGTRDSFLFPEIKRRVTEALIMDDRITGTSDFVFARQRERVTVRFTVHTVYGDADFALEV